MDTPNTSNTPSMTQEEYEMIAPLLRRARVAPIVKPLRSVRSGVTKNKSVPANKAKKRMAQASRRMNRNKR
jgi:hypothetical protein